VTTTPAATTTASPTTTSAPSATSSPTTTSQPLGPAPGPPPQGPLPGPAAAVAPEPTEPAPNVVNIGGIPITLPWPAAP
jgi:hypothetical protein